MYGAIVAAMLTTTAPAAPDWCWDFQGFGCGPFCYPGSPCYPYCCDPCWGGYGCSSCAGPVAAADGTGGPDRSATAARVVVRLPADARLFVDDDPCTLTSAERSFDTPDLQPGVTYRYTIRAEVTRAGRPVTEIKRVTVRAGQETVVEFGEMLTVTAGR